MERRRHNHLEASSHREAPLIADDPLADNTDLYAFRSPRRRSQRRQRHGHDCSQLHSA
ncbi:MAG: DUF4331 family protein [Hymenobacter sp.]